MSRSRCPRSTGGPKRLGTLVWLVAILLAPPLVSRWLATDGSRRPAEASVTPVVAATPALSPSVALASPAKPVPPGMAAMAEPVVTVGPAALVVTSVPASPPPQPLASPVPAAAVVGIELPTPSPTPPSSRRRPLPLRSRRLPSRWSRQPPRLQCP